MKSVRGGRVVSVWVRILCVGGTGRVQRVEVGKTRGRMNSVSEGRKIFCYLEGFGV